MARAVPPVRAKAWSAPTTSRRVLDLLAGLDWETAFIVDVGAGRGHFAQLVCQTLRAKQLVPDARVFACDLIPASFECDDIPCAPIGVDGRLPYEDDRFDAVVSIEVIEHAEDQFAFMRELAWIAKPGGVVIVTTPPGPCPGRARARLRSDRPTTAARSGSTRRSHSSGMANFSW